MSNQEIVRLFRNVAAAYAIKDEKKYKFQIIAYQKAADAIDHASVELKNLYHDNKIDIIPGIGTTIKSRLTEFFSTGRVRHFDELLAGIPSPVFPLLNIPSFGPKKAYKLVSYFKLKNPETVIKDIKNLAVNGRIAEIEGFGKKSEEDIIRALTEYDSGTNKSRRMVLPFANHIAEQIVAYLRKNGNVIDVKPLGSLRRMAATVGDVDIAISSYKPENVIEYFANYPDKERLIEKGPTTASFLIGGGWHVDLLALQPEMYGSMLQHFTGSKHHNVALREYAVKRGFSLSERGIKYLNKPDKPIKTFQDEKDFYNFLGLDWIPPEIRENLGEIEKAKIHALPKLVEISDIKGDLHIHTNYPFNSSHDYGINTVEEMIDNAKKLGYEYIGISDHNPSISNNDSNKIYSILEKRFDFLNYIEKSNKNIRVIKLLECDILSSGKLAVHDKALKFVDGLIVSIHSSFSTEKEKMTDRILRGLSHPKAKIFAHPTGRLLNSRTGYEVNWERLFTFAMKNNKALEINAWPERLDLPDMLVKEAKEKGIKFVINTDSHALAHMDNMKYGVSVARRGWCETNDILNTLPFSKFYNWLMS